MSGPARRFASVVLTAASRLLPAQLSSWSLGMTRELEEIGQDRAALAFALGCLRAAFIVAVAERLRASRSALPGKSSPPSLSIRSPMTMTAIFASPRTTGLLCGAVAVALGMSYLFAAGAPGSYLVVNLAALILGAALWLALGRTTAMALPGAGAILLVLAASLLATALFGVAADGASRWVKIGPLALQVSFILLPSMLVLYARRPDAIGTVAMIAAAAALALQPDRAMAGVMLAGLLGLSLARPGPLPVAAVAASILAFGWALLVPDRLPAVPYVDRILYTAFDVHPLAGFAVVGGAMALLLPALVGVARGQGHSASLFAFGGCWAGVVAASALGNHPTPLVGYGGSAVLGYLLSTALLPNRASAVGRGADSVPANESRNPDPGLTEQRIAHPA